MRKDTAVQVWKGAKRRNDVESAQPCLVNEHPAGVASTARLLKFVRHHQHARAPPGCPRARRSQPTRTGPSCRGRRLLVLVGRVDQCAAPGVFVETQARRRARAGYAAVWKTRPVWKTKAAVASLAGVASLVEAEGRSGLDLALAGRAGARVDRSLWAAVVHTGTQVPEEWS